ncbi:MAG: hypothetical protein ACFE8N_09015 [Promethearchaeota archaeon]
MILSIILIALSVTISLIGIIYVFLNQEDYGTTLNKILNILLYLLLGVIFFSLYSLSTEVIIDQNAALILWKFSMVFWVISISILSITQVLVIKFKKLTIIPSIFYALIGGLITTLAFLPDSIILIQSNPTHYSYHFKNAFLLIILIAYNLSIFTFMWYNFIKNLPNFRKKELAINLGLLTLHFTFIILIYTLHIISRIIIFRYIYLIVYLSGSAIAVYNIIKHPAFLVELTNRIYDFIIFHKSGILLYSYNFETGTETEDSLLKGSILIGINHILSSFIDKKDQLSLIKMKERDIVFEYDNSLGYAILLTTNNKNKFIEKAVNNFMENFSELNEKKLKSMKGLIDISEFHNAKKLLYNFFAPYIIKTQ